MRSPETHPEPWSAFLLASSEQFVVSGPPRPAKVTPTALRPPEKPLFVVRAKRSSSAFHLGRPSGRRAPVVPPQIRFPFSGLSVWPSMGRQQIAPEGKIFCCLSTIQHLLKHDLQCGRSCSDLLQRLRMTSGHPTTPQGSAVISPFIYGMSANGRRPAARLDGQFNGGFAVVEECDQVNA